MCQQTRSLHDTAGRAELDGALLAALVHASPAVLYSCKVADDDTGHFFVADLRDIGVATNRHRRRTPGKSGRCLVLITPDAERSMNTFLGIFDQLVRIDPTDLDWQQGLANSYRSVGTVL